MKLTPYHLGHPIPDFLQDQYQKLFEGWRYDYTGNDIRFKSDYGFITFHQGGQISGVINGVQILSKTSISTDLFSQLLNEQE